MLYPAELRTLVKEMGFKSEHASVIRYQMIDLEIGEIPLGHTTETNSLDFRTSQHCGEFL